MYFTPDQIRKVTSKFSSCLSSDGYLIPGIVEVNDDNFPDFKPIQLGSCTIYYKGFSTSQRLENQLVDKSTFKLNTSSITVRQPLKERHIKSAANKAKPKPLQLPVVQKELHVVQTDPRGLLAAGEYEKCITQCLEKLKNDENNPELITLLVKAYANTGNLMESIEWGNRLVQLSTCRDSHYYLVAQIMYESGNNESTLQILKKALYLNPHHLFSHYLTGLVLQRLGKNETAQKHFRNALDLLEKHQDEDILVDAEGLTAGRIKQLIINVKNNG
jgi:chemotaxis protein methyltransferase CheR